MNKYKTQQRLKRLLDRPGFIFHEKIFGEIEDIIIGSGKEAWFVSVLTKNMSKLEALGDKAIDGKNIERLKETQGLCSIKMRCKELNLRLLFSFDKFQYKIMLHLFFEKDDSKRGQYSTHIPIALERKRELEGE